MTDYKQQLELQKLSEEQRRSDDVFYHLLKRPADSPVSSEEWVRMINEHVGSYTPTGIEECIQRGDVTIDEDQVVRLTDRGEAHLEELKRRN